ncbi:hypothetical protein FHX41_5702 [Actinomadura hallensis]|uniref:Uncharacterized protein n=1 Tax=Actinomadura hallensis TaxID=337895 RepID=A0A543IMW5_9ACTN|nr:hypothetical protein FHX41_5702 [Actinomadura hallensis]
MLATQFFGGALAPVIYVPLYAGHGDPAFAATAVGPVLAVLVFLGLRSPRGVST